MHYRFLLLSCLLFTACDNGAFEKDKRQIRAKDEIRRLLPQGSTGFDVLGFSEDTVNTWKDSLLQRPIRYRIDFIYTGPAGKKEQKTGAVFFTPDGRSVLETQIADKQAF